MCFRYIVVVQKNNLASPLHLILWIQFESLCIPILFFKFNVVLGRSRIKGGRGMHPTLFVRTESLTFCVSRLDFGRKNSETRKMLWTCNWPEIGTIWKRFAIPWMKGSRTLCQSISTSES